MRTVPAIRVLFICLASPFFAGFYPQAPTNAPAATQPPAQAQSQAAADSHAANTESSNTKTPPAEQTAQSGVANESATVLRATTRLVMLDVVATDSHGHPSLDLTADDFTVLEDGKPQKVRAFGFQHPIPATPNPIVKNLPPNVFTNIPQFQVSSSMNVILLDALNTPMTSQAYMRQKMLHFIETMPTGSPTAVYTLGQKLRLVQDFTTDPNILKEAIKKTGGGQSSPLLDNPVDGGEVELYPPGFFDSLSTEAQAAVQSFEAERTSVQTDLRVHYTMDALRSIAHSLAGYQRRKNLIWISQAFPLAINPDATVSSNPEFGAQRNYTDEIAKTAELLTDSQIAVYPVDAGGLIVSSSFSAANSGGDRFGRRTTSGPAFGNALSLESNNLIQAHGAMDTLAERTGGKAYYNRNDLDTAIRESLDDGSTYYILGYYPENKDWNGKFRKIQVKVLHSGVKLRYRLGYYATDPKAYANESPTQRTRELGDAMNLDHPVSTAIFFEAGVTPPSEQTHNKIGIRYAIDAHALVIEHGEDGADHADVECVVQAYDAKGKPVIAGGNGVKATLTPETYRKVMQSGFPCNTELALPEGSYLLRLGVRDDRSGLIGTANARVTVPKLGETAKPQ